LSPGFTALIGALKTGKNPNCNLQRNFSAFRHCRYRLEGNRRSRTAWIDPTVHADPREAMQDIFGDRKIIYFEVES
jgi:hypothetical protein